jgi:hypothetical protein
VLFRLRTADQIKGRMTMLNTGPSQQAGVVAYRLDGCSSPQLPGQQYGAVGDLQSDQWLVATRDLQDEVFTPHPVQPGRR